MGLTRRKEEERLIRKNDIIDAAERVFFDKGYESSTMDDIAKEAEFTKKTLYSYFRSKEELYFEIMIRGFKALNGMLDKALGECGGKSEVERIRVMGLTFFEFSRKYPGHVKAIGDYENRDSDFSGSPDNELVMRCYAEGQYSLGLLRGCVERGVKNGELPAGTDPDTASLFLWSCLQGFLEVVNRKKRFLNAYFKKDVREIVQYGFDVLFNSIKQV